MPVQVSRQPQSQPQPHHSNHSNTSLTGTNASSYSLRRDSPASSRDDSSSVSSLSLDGRQRKRLLKNPESTTLPRNPALREPRSPPKLNRIRDQKKPVITRGSDLVSSTTENSSRLYHSGPSALTNANINDHESRQISGQVDNNVTTFYAFRENKSNVVGASQSGSAIIEKAGISGVGGSGLDDPFDFEQSMNLEDVHRGIIDSEQLNSFSNPVPTRKTSNGNMLSTRSTSHLVDRNKGQIQNIQMASSGAPPGSMLRRPSITKYSQPQNRDQQSMARRRQSGASNMSNSTLSSATYRKSMTTTIEPESSTRNQRRKTGVGSSSLNPPIPKYPSGGYSESSADGGVKVSLNPRMTKSKSLQPPARQSTYSGLNPTDPTDHFRSPVGFPPKPPKSPGFTRKLGTPNSAASRRISIIPHASGLAARTISPTDARRMKRISMLKTPPPMPDSAKNTPRGGSPSMIPRKSVTPSSQGTTPEPQRKSYNSGLSTASTCTSVRTSVGSLQPKMPSNLGGSRLPRPPQLERDDEDIPPVPPLPKNLASPSEPASGEASRAHSHESTPLSTFKSNSSLFGPRKSSLAPEHPNELTDPTETSKSAESDHALSSDSPIGRARSSNSSVLPPRKSCLSESYRELDTYGHDFSSDHPESEKSEQLEDPSATFDLESFEHTNSESIMQEQNLPKKEKTWAEKETRRRRGMTIGGMGLGGSSFHMLENKASASSLRNKKDLAPIRLPPLNLLPLSTPTIARVNALGSAASDSDEFMTPTKKGINTPATPMTASKASFFNRRERDDGGASVHERSMSSFNHSSSAAQDRTPSSLSLRAGSSASSGIPISTSSRMGRQTISPYIPNSVPSTVTKATGHELKEKELTGLARMRAKSRSRKSHDSLKNASAVDDSATDPLSTTSSIRRKLSLSWKKSSQGKNSHAATERAEEYSQGVGAKFDNMPPPRLPSSSNWTPGTAGTPSPSKAAHAPFQSRRKGSGGSGSLLGQHDRTRSNSWGTTNGPKKEKKQLEDKPPVIPSKQSTASSILSPMTKMLGSKGSLGQLRGGRDRDRASHSTDPNLDHDDLIAEEEMRKIAMKRKNMDQAAAQLDDLKRRAHPKERMAPQQMLRSGVLNIFEKGEIVDYKDIYFAGLSDAKKLVGDLKSSNLHNFGYDDERGDYTIIKGDHLAYRYEIVDILGKGSFGQVVRCIDHKTGGLVAIKIIRNKKRFHQQALVEVNILQKLKEWDPHQKHSLINFTQSFYFRGHLCISTELLGMNLYEFIKSNDFRGFSLKLIRRFTKQMLSSLLLLKGHRVIHCDLKPENILLAHPAHTEIKVIDFGSSCFENEKVYTYIQSRFYRSPEVILGMSYGLAIDMWSLGCILAELFTGYPIFPGENEQEQLACIMEVFGPPEKHLIEKSTRRKLFFDSQGKPRMIVSTKGRRRRVSSKSLQYVLKCDDDPFLDFVSRCLRWDPEKRMKPDEAMNHEFITGRKPQISTRSRSGNYASATASSDTRRYTAYSRPLPEPPGIKKPVGSNSPMKSSGTNNSTVAPSSARKPGTTTTAGNKRNSIGASIGSALPRAAATGYRSISGRNYASNAAGAGSMPSTGGRASAQTQLRAGAGTSGSVKLVRDEDAGMSSGGEGRRR